MKYGTIGGLLYFRLDGCIYSDSFLPKVWETYSPKAQHSQVKLENFREGIHKTVLAAQLNMTTRLCDEKKQKAV